MHQVLSRLNQDDIANVYGVKYVAGIDECGNGAACGPITAAVCVFKVDTVLPIKDSKKYSNEVLREVAEREVLKNSKFSMVASSSVKDINEHGHVKAWEHVVGMLLKAVAGRYKPEEVLIVIDGSLLPKNMPKVVKNFKIRAVPKADTKIQAVMAASIIGKCDRDRYMTKLSETGYYEPYGLDKCKGYLTPEHIKAVYEFGLTTQHRTNVTYPKPKVPLTPSVNL
jgi:ribonuclease HII